MCHMYKLYVTYMQKYSTSYMFRIHICIFHIHGNFILIMACVFICVWDKSWILHSSLFMKYQ